MRHLPIAIRAYTERAEKPKAQRKGSQRQETSWPRHVIVFDTETTTDKTQRLTFGGYHVCRWSEDGTQLECMEEGLFYADELPKTDPEGFALLQDYTNAQRAKVISDVPDEIQLLSRTQFVEDVLYRVGYETRALIVGFNLPFDLSRVAIGCGTGRRRNRGGFSLVLSGYRKGRRGRLRPNPFRPRVQIRHLDSKKAFIEFDKPHKLDPDNQRPADGMPPDPNFAFKGRFLDLRTLAFALTAKSYTLAKACEDFDVEHGKAETEKHGVITPEYIDYARRDVLATQGLLGKLRAEFDRHPIELDPCKAYSPASLAKAYSQAMGLARPRAQFDALPPEVQGQAMSAFFGGRAEVDFLSMYPTIQVLMELGNVLSAEKLEIEEVTAEVQALLDRATLEDVFRPEFWQELCGFAEIIPKGDILPTRARHNDTEWTVGVNRLTSHVPLWYGLPDLVASKLLTGKAPQIRRAYRLIPKGKQAGLRSVRFGGAVSVDPRRENIFKTAIEERQRIKRDASLSDEERERLQLGLKTFANAWSYGVNVEMNRKDLPAKESRKVSIYGRDGRFEFRTTNPEEPGPYFFSPVAALITGGARLMLAALERCVTDAGGSYAFADTDSMAIVANRDGGLVPCEGGPHRLPDGGAAVQALSWAEADGIVERFESLNPYDRDAVPGSILKIEDVNRDPETGERRGIYTYAISSKRYALFTLDSEGRPEVLNVGSGYSEHGLGQFLNPLDPDSEDTSWVRAVWQGLIEEAFGGDRFEPEWMHRPAVMRTSVSTPGLRKRFEGFNRKKPFAKQIKPFNFLLSITVPSIEWPRIAHECGGFHLIAPYSRNPLEWFKSSWTDLYSNRIHRIRSRKAANGTAIRVQDFEDVLTRFRDHPESKSGDAEGNRSDSETTGLLGRLHLQVLSVLHIGKETNLLEQQEEGVLLADPQAVYFGGGEWETTRPNLDGVSISELAVRSGVSQRMLRNLRQGTRSASHKTLEAIAAALVRMLDGS
jgi:hypothetical protein